jgi:uncharacterized protein YbaP (TraB family)
MIGESENRMAIRMKTNSLFLLITALLVVMLSCTCSTTDNPPQKSVPVETPVISSPTTPEQTNKPTETVSTPTSDIEPKKNGKLFIWTISSDTTDIYLLGSIHVASPDIYPLNSSIEDVFEIAENLVVEVDVTVIDVEETMALMFEYGMYSNGETLKKNLPEDLYASLDEFFKELGLNIGLFNSVRPWVISMLIEQLAVDDLGYAAEYGIDYYFLEKASESNKNIIELESAELQFEMLSSFSDEFMIFYIEESLENLPEKEEVERLFEAWQNGDVDTMESIVFEALIEEPELTHLYDVLFSQRNIMMADKIEEFLADDEVYFVVVGAGHLIGEGGLIDILSDRGFETEQLNNND